MNGYTINPSTLAIIPISEHRTKVYEENNIIIVPKSTQKLIEENCIHYGSSYAGRKKGTVDLIGVTHKSPIVIEDSKNIIFFPTCSPRLKNKCGWISLNNIENYKAYENTSIIKFQNDLTLKIPISNKSLDNQILRATRLESVFNKRKSELLEKKS